MRICHACGQVRPNRWRNEPGTHPPERIHVAGPIIVDRVARQPGFPWGRVVDRTQHCTDCGDTLIRGLWALFFEPGARVLEHGWTRWAPILRDATDRDTAKSCLEIGEGL